MQIDVIDVIEVSHHQSRDLRLEGAMAPWPVALIRARPAKSSELGGRIALGERMPMVGQKVREETIVWTLGDVGINLVRLSGCPTMFRPRR